MEAREMRIGNYYDFSNSGQIEQITGKDIYEFESDPIDDIYYPIPLTEEWLLRFGFIKYKTLDTYPTFGKQMFNWNNGVLYIVGYGFVNHIKHVHQLQNLYFALTGEELTIKK